MSMSISAKNLTVAYGEKTILSGVDISFPAGRVSTIIGPNGCGKSTLLKSVARIIPAQSGSIEVGGDDALAMKRRQLAKKIALLPQTPMAPPGLPVADLVARGRHPHQSWIRQWSATDEEVVYTALKFTGSEDLADQPIDALSGGQRQRVWISMVLAQNTDVLFLDEPTTYLDLSHSIEVLNLVQHLKKTLGRTIVMVLHDLNLAVRYSDHLVVMAQGRILAEGTPQDIMIPQLLEQVFGLDALVVEDPAVGGPLIVPR
ncbi:ATP-binding cassette domain-containing protein [Corynebacterium poyangense]|uniref:ATP-binding cassette domain-containing protein n=1 Tax=Corynebacterium poyangense TaxID=2684405 RepID=A0A7H0SM62_9CORY|nr:ABC transporter ATP-binding protein [Corynebacterium poyangense]MBZ8176733.1 ATP-binding cassette domain-containing protein [Corynebacterium poyangense]QNQ89637.1 ATP-binding cassette domain-containing protein [Corynebacterium poyangense]